MQLNLKSTITKAAKIPHEIFLINLISNHILLFVGLLGMMKNYPWLTFVTPILSLVILSYILWRAKIAQKSDEWFVMCHWQIAAKRARLFILLLMVMAMIIMAILMSVGGEAAALRPGHYAIGGVAILPTMLSVLVLIIMESDAMHQAGQGRIGDNYIKRYPPPEPLQRVEGADFAL